MQKVLLCVLDGIGLSNEKKGNAFYEASTPNLDMLINKYSFKGIEASGKFVGLPDNQIGNSEVGHLTIGLGRVVDQPLTRINKSIKEKSFFSNVELVKAINHAKKNKSKLHILGLLSDGGVHSSIDHFFAILKTCKSNNFTNVYFHIFTDGRDTNYKSCIKYLDLLQEKINKYKIGTIATISGRYYAMDRDRRWDRIKKVYDLLVFNVGKEFKNYKDAIKYNYDRKIYDEFIKPCIIDKKGLIENNDSIIWSNFRSDRSRQLLSSLVNNNFRNFKIKQLKNINLTTLMWVSDSINSNIMFKPSNINNTLGEYLSNLGYKQLRIAETEKYAHVTYFFDGLRNLDLKNCKKILIPSPKVSTYDLRPEMSAKKITESLLKEMDDDYDFIFLNFANGDMLGHTGNLKASIIGIETIDEMIGKIYNKCVDNNYLFIITSDHGNCENMMDKNGVITKHSNNKVPFILCENEDISEIKSISHIAPFILEKMEIKVPSEMK